MKATCKEKVGKKIMITTETKRWLGIIKEERWFVVDGDVWSEWPEKTQVTDIELIEFLNENLKKLPLTYIIK